jgi:hypothetical protein
MIAEYVFVLAQWSFVEDYFSPFFSPLRKASAKGLSKQTTYNNNLPTQTNEVIFNPGNPVNPDSKTISCCARNFQRRPGKQSLVWK